MKSENFGSLKEKFVFWGKFQKAGGNLREILNLSIPIIQEYEQIGYLVPFSVGHQGNEKLMEYLTNWRNANNFAYPTRFYATKEATSKWFLDQVINNDSRVLFWIVTNEYEYVGHIGLTCREEINGLEIDNVSRGNELVPGIMSSSLRALEVLVEEEFSVEIISLRVLESNKRAIAFYEKMHYEVVEKTPVCIKTNYEDNDSKDDAPLEDFFFKMEKNLTNINPIPSQILTAGPSISNLESYYVDDAVRNGWNSNHSDYLNRFESEFAVRIGAKFAMATSSCTGALHLALLALGIGEGDEVIVPEITWVATASAVSYVGATPIFADVDQDSWTISVDEIRSLITEKTKAIIPVHLYGYPSNMEEIISLARVKNIRVIEDAAPAIGASFGETSVGTFGDFGCFSFQGAKLLVSGEGGVLVTNNEELFLKAKKIQDHGRKPGTFWIEEIGHKYKMNNITGALGLGQLLRLDNQILRKQRINSWYSEFLGGVEGIKFQNEVPGSKSICWMTSIEFDVSLGIKTEDLMKKLKLNGVDSRPVFPAISQYPIWGRNLEARPNAKRIGENSINLPSGVKLPRAAIEKVSELIREIVAK